MRSVNVLVTSAGTASGISVIKALRRQSEYDIRILAVDADKSAAGLYLADACEMVPKCSQAGYVERIFQLCERDKIDSLFPIYSTEIEVLAAQSDALAARGVATLVAPPKVVRQCNDKRWMYKLVEELGVAFPKIVDPASDGLRFPLFAKPVTATGGVGAMVIDGQTDLDYCAAKNAGFIFQEFVKGPEYTVDILCDRTSEMVICSPRLRLSVKAGQSVKGRTARVPRLEELSRMICKSAGIVGPCNLQFIEREGDYVFIEINPRYPAGGLILTVAAGANLPLLALKLMLGEPVARPLVREGVTMLRYWEEIILDEKGGMLPLPVNQPAVR